MTHFDITWHCWCALKESWNNVIILEDTWRINIRVQAVNIKWWIDQTLKKCDLQQINFFTLLFGVYNYTIYLKNLKKKKKFCFVCVTCVIITVKAQTVHCLTKPKLLQNTSRPKLDLQHVSRNLCHIIISYVASFPPVMFSCTAIETWSHSIEVVIIPTDIPEFGKIHASAVFLSKKLHVLT